MDFGAAGQKGSRSSFFQTVQSSRYSVLERIRLPTDKFKCLLGIYGSTSPYERQFFPRDRWSTLDLKEPIRKFEDGCQSQGNRLWDYLSGPGNADMIRYSFDKGHLNKEGTVIFSRKFAELARDYLD